MGSHLLKKGTKYNIKSQRNTEIARDYKVSNISPLALVRSLKLKLLRPHHVHHGEHWKEYQSMYDFRWSGIIPMSVEATKGDKRQHHYWRSCTMPRLWPSCKPPCVLENRIAWTQETKGNRTTANNIVFQIYYQHRIVWLQLNTTIKLQTNGSTCCSISANEMLLVNFNPATVSTEYIKIVYYVHSCGLFQ